MPTLLSGDMKALVLSKKPCRDFLNKDWRESNRRRARTKISIGNWKPLVWWRELEDFLDRLVFFLAYCDLNNKLFLDPTLRIHLNNSRDSCFEVVCA